LSQEAILEAAALLFSQQGYAATTLAEVAHKSEVNPGSLYYFFPTKEALLAAVLQRYLKNMFPLVMKPVFDKYEDPIQRIFGVLEEYRGWVEMTHCEFTCPIGRLVLELGPEHPEIFPLLAKNFEQWSAVMRDCLTAARHRLPRGTDVASLGQFVLTVMEGAVMQARARRNLEVYDASVKELRNYFRLLMRNKRGRNVDAKKTAH